MRREACFAIAKASRVECVPEGDGLSSGMATGTPDELTARFRSLADRGVERFYVWFTDFAPTATLQTFGEVVAALAG